MATIHSLARGFPIHIDICSENKKTNEELFIKKMTDTFNGKLTAEKISEGYHAF